MKPDDIAVRRSKLLSLILRHEPHRAGLTLETGGWVRVDDLLSGLAAMGEPLTRHELDEIVETNSKKRFTVSPDGTRIRAAQGHSVAIEADLAPVTPPDTLYHGTASRFLDAILAQGLRPMSRQHVHLSSDTATAVEVGRRHGKPVVLAVAARAMAGSGHRFYQADNGVWLTDGVAPEYLTLLP